MPREQMKLRTRSAIAASAAELFLQQGFTKVSMTQIADHAGVSRKTVGHYYPVKEDLVVDRFVDGDHQVVKLAAVRLGEEGALDAIHDHFQLGLLTRDPVTGLNDDPENIALYRMVQENDSLAARLHDWARREEDALTWSLDERCERAVHPEVSRSVAVMVLGQLALLARENWGFMLDGKKADAHYEYAIQRADDSWDLLKNGANGYHNIPELPGDHPEQ
ncbi:TetR/AcrR family transcriptional regulator [Pseudonocardiaceae bacterium YIM PH 21723]|nr:TetR/AcrR family transcriptional regulator [Pseudonocardiaceae bacterium YIM PH 21723]